MKYDFSKIVIKGLDGTEVADIHKSIADMLYKMAKDLSLVDVALKMYNGEEVELTVSQIEEVKKIVNDEKSGIYAFARKAIIDYLENGSK